MISTKGLDTSRVVSEKILKQFGMRISSGLIRRYRRKFGKNIRFKIIQSDFSI